MRKKIINFLDFIAAFMLTGIFLSLAAVMLLFARFRQKRHKKIKDVMQLCISILDFRKTVISSFREDIPLEGFIKKTFVYHFAFGEKENTHFRLSDRIYQTNMSVHPDNALTRAGFMKTAACMVEVKTFFAMLKTVRSEGINIIRAHDPHLLGFNAYLLSRATGVPFIVQVCSNYELKDRQAKGLTFAPFMFAFLERWFERAIMRSADMVMTDREHYRSFGLIPKDIPEEKYGNVGFFVNEVHYTPLDSRKNLRADLGIAQGKKILLYVGRLCEVKHPFDLLKILKEIMKKRGDVVLLIAGDGPLREGLEQAVFADGIGNNVLFIRKISQEKLRDIYYTADVTCFTSAGFTMVEAALAGSPIVAYDFEWHAEFIGRNERGILVPFGDCVKFAEKVLEVLDNAALRHKTGEAARSYALKHYSRKDAIEKEIGVYKSAFKNRGYII